MCASLCCRWKSKDNGEAKGAAAAAAEAKDAGADAATIRAVMDAALLNRREAFITWDNEFGVFVGTMDGPTNMLGAVVSPPYVLVSRGLQQDALEVLFQGGRARYIRLRLRQTL